jgi:NAD(P)-dependent dehydrogenase (short-subunit alcohol dehydrogenase family)
VPVLDRFRLDRNIAVSTSASSGLGVAFASARAGTGAEVVIGARPDRLPDTASPAGRRGDPAELGAVGVVLASDFLGTDGASQVTGVTIPVAGGMTMP